MRPVTDFVGKGLALPLVPGETGRLDANGGEARVRQAIHVILETEPGERLMLPRFGCPLRQFLMQPNTPLLRARIERAVTDALDAHEPRITLDDVAAQTAGEPSLVLVTIRFRHSHDNRPGNLVFPFYLE